MSLNRFLKSLGGRKAKATHSGTPGSHVNKKCNKRIASKAIRAAFNEWHEMHDLILENTDIDSINCPWEKSNETIK